MRCHKLSRSSPDPNTKRVNGSGKEIINVHVAETGFQKENSAATAVNMESAQEVIEESQQALLTGKIIRCGCPRASAAGTEIDGWHVASKDKRVESRPEYSVQIHACGNLIVYQERKGLTRFYRPIK